MTPNISAVAATALRKSARRGRSGGRAVVAALEPRRLLSAGRDPSTYEQYMIELINRARADPAAEASRLGVELNEGLSAGTISTAAKQPLAPLDGLTGAARDHASWLRVNGKFQHEGENGTTPTQRILASNFAARGSWGTGENLGVVMGTSLGDVAGRIDTIHKNLFVDRGIAGRGHRVNLLGADFETVGSGIATGPYAYDGKRWQAVLAAQDFAYQSGDPYLTGVAFADTLKTDNFYSPGEGMDLVVVTARAADGKAYADRTRPAGSYAIQLPAGTYTVTATDTDGKTATYKNVVVGDANVKRDFTQAQFAAANASNLPAPGADGTAVLGDDGRLLVTGTKNRDVIRVVADDDYVTVTLNGTATRFGVALVTAVQVEAGRGDDAITLGGNVRRPTLVGGAGDDEIQGGDAAELIHGGDDDDLIRGGVGDDTVHGGAGNDNLSGNAGKNVLHGDDGSDRLNGGGGRDYLFGEAGNDRLYGNAGNDDLDGGGNNDRCYGGDGDDLLAGGTGNDRLYAEAGNDTLVGGRGSDVFDGGGGTKDRAADRDDIESVLNVERM